MDIRTWRIILLANPSVPLLESDTHASFGTESIDMGSEAILTGWHKMWATIPESTFKTKGQCFAASRRFRSRDSRAENHDGEVAAFDATGVEIC